MGKPSLMEHVRIDEGIKRGPRKKTGPKPSSPRRNNGQFVPTLPNDPESISKALQDYAQGATLEQIGAQHGVTKQAVYGWLLGELGGEQHSALVTRALTARIARADGMIEEADNPLDLQRGRELSRNFRLDLERRRSNLYGNRLSVETKQELDPASLELASAAQELLKLFREKVVNPIPEQIQDKSAPLSDSDH